jgi:LAO/AO transport system kinase
MLTLGERVEGGWTPPVLKSIASRGEGIEKVVGAIDAHLDWLKSTGTLGVRRRRRASLEVEAITVATLRARLSVVHGDARLESLAERVATGELDPYAAADLLVDGLS